MPYTLLDPATAAAAPITTIGAPLTSVGETLATMRAWLTNALSNRTTLLPAQYNAWINTAYRQITGMVKPLELDGNVQLALVANQPLYLLPANVAYTRDMSLADPTDFQSGGRPLEKIDLPKYRRLPSAPYGTISMPPRSWFRFGRMAVIWPTPLAAYTAVLDCKCSILSLVNDTDSPILQQDLHFAIELLAKRVALRDLKAYQEAAIAQNDFLEYFRPLLNTDAEENADAEFTFQPAREAGDIYNDEG